MKVNFLRLLLIGQLAFITTIKAQNIAINGTGSLPDTSAMLDVSSTIKGFLAPRMSTKQQDAIPLPAKGLLIFNTSDNEFKVNTGDSKNPLWKALSSEGGAATTNLLTSSLNAMTSTTNGVAGSAPIINTNTLSLSGSNLTSSVNGVVSQPVNLSGISAQPWYNTATSTAATANTQNIYQSGNVGIGLNNPGNQLVVNNTIEIRRPEVNGAVAQLLFTNTGGDGDFRLGGDGGDVYWQGGGGRALQMGSFWTTILGGDRQTSTFPAMVNGITGTSVIVAAQRDVSVALGIQANSASQSANLTEWRTATGAVLSVVDKSGNMGLGLTAPAQRLHVNGQAIITTLNAGNATDDIVTVDATGLLKKRSLTSMMSSGMITSLNGINTSAQTFATSNTGTDFTISTSSPVHTFSLPDAAAGARGVVNTGVQVFAGNKSFTGATTFTGTLTATSPVTISSLASGAVADSILTVNAAGVLRKRTVASFFSGSTANSLTSSGNSITSIVNGTSANAAAVNSVVNTVSGNNLTTSVNGVSSTAAMVNTNGLSLSGTNLISTVNGLVSPGLNLAPLITAATTNTLVSSNNALTNTTNGVASTVNMVNSVANTSSNNVLTTAVNGVAAQNVSIINSNALSLSGNSLISTVNGLASPALNLTPLVAAATTNTLISSNNALTSTTNGVASTVNMVNSVANTSSANVLVTKVNGVTAPNVSIINSNVLALTGTSLSSTVNGVVSPGISLSGILPYSPTMLVSASRTTAYTPAAAYATLAYNSAGTNVGTAYNTTTGIFTAPATGLYQIIISNMYTTSDQIINNVLSGRIVVNSVTDTEVALSLVTPSTANPVKGNLTANTVVQMTSGQTASIQTGGEISTMTPVVGTGQHTLKIIRLN